MKKFRVLAAIGLLATVLFMGSAPPSSAQFGTEGCGRCNCHTPNTGKSGVKQATDDSCPPCDCYVDMND